MRQFWIKHPIIFRELMPQDSGYPNIEITLVRVTARMTSSSDIQTQHNPKKVIYDHRSNLALFKDFF